LQVGFGYIEEKPAGQTTQKTKQEDILDFWDLPGMLMLFFFHWEMIWAKTLRHLFGAFQTQRHRGPPPPPA
jgi:hypothetical protein